MSNSFFELGTPVLVNGDDSHYLLFANSILRDGDFDLKNNYESAMAGGLDAGRAVSGLIGDPHVVWLIDGKRYFWTDFFDRNLTKEETEYRPDRKMKQIVAPSLKPNLSTPLPDGAWYAYHPMGMPILLSIFLQPFRSFSDLSVFAVLISAFFLLAASVFFRKIILHFGAGESRANAITLLCFLASPIWFYATTLFTESFLVFFAIAACYFALKNKKQNALLAGLCIAYGSFCKPPFMLFLIPIIIYFFLERRELVQKILLCIFPMVSFCSTLYMNSFMYGSAFTPAFEFKAGNPLVGFWGIWFDLQHGLIPFMPIILLGLLSLPTFFRKHKNEAIYFFCSALFYILFMSTWIYWHGNWNYGPRLVLASIPFLIIPMIYLPEISKYRKKFFSIFVRVSVIFSLLVGISAMSMHYAVWNMHPFIYLKNNNPWTHLYRDACEDTNSCS